MPKIQPQPISKPIQSKSRSSKKILKSKRRIIRKVRTRNRNRKIALPKNVIVQPPKTKNGLKDLLQHLSKQNLLLLEHYEMLLDICAPNFDAFEKQLLKPNKFTRRRIFRPSQEFRSFAINLNFYSPKGYRYVRKKFHTYLPDPTTICQWYKNSNFLPGFTAESFERLTKAVKKFRKNIYANLICGEMALHSSETEFIDIGDQLETDVKASDAFVFIVAGINHTWKIPVGYFLINSITAEQKQNLIGMCIDNLLLTGIKIVGISIDTTTASNLATCKLLCCELDWKKSEFWFKTSQINKRVCILPDLCRNLNMIKEILINVSPLIDQNGNEVNWKYLLALEKLQELQLNSKAMEYFRKEKINCKLAVQTMDKSVAGALDYCREV